MAPEHNRLRVVHVVRQFHPSVGGLETAVVNLAAKQREMLGIDARVVTLDREFGQSRQLKHEDVVAGIPVTRIPWRGSSRYPIAPSVLRHVKSADVIHVHAIDFFFDFLALSKLVHGRKMIASTHGGFFHTSALSKLKQVWFNIVTRLSILSYFKIVACSQSDANMFTPITGKKLELIENGIDQDRFNGAAASTQLRTIIYFGRFAEHKRIESIFPLLAALRHLNPSWRVIIAGRNADQNIEQLKGMAEIHSVIEAVEFNLGPDDDNLRMLIGRASYSICLSSYEGFGLAAVEAMSAGLLPILSGIAPFQRLINETKIGLIVDVDDYASAAAAIEQTVLDDESAYIDRQNAARNSVLRYEWGEVAKKYADIYAEAMGEISALSIHHGLGQGT